MRLHLILPVFEKNKSIYFNLIVSVLRRTNRDLFDTRRGFSISFDTSISYYKTDGDYPSWFSVSILGFGIGVSWDYDKLY